LIEELQEELKKGDVREASSIAANLKDNEEKINLHGRRADSIVKGMLQHSRSSTGQKDYTDINKLVDEYTRLAYHGFIARNKEFNVKLDINLDPNLPLVPVMAQDIGRVILNLLNNAFQAVQEKARAVGDGYQPMVTVSTKRNPQGLEIRVSDNGPGIPEAIKDKIFQPFFTTKPTGQGTGLGLSLSYDIVKAHGGLIELLDGQPSGSVFQLVLPVNGSLQA
jgi:signal transduction histidine kinase